MSLNMEPSAYPFLKLSDFESAVFDKARSEIKVFYPKHPWLRLSNKRHIIGKKMIAAGFPGDVVLRPSAGHKVHVKKPDDTGGKRDVDYQPPADEWSKDPDTRRRIIRDYLSASPEDKEAMRQQYPDIEAEAGEG